LAFDVVIPDPEVFAKQDIGIAVDHDASLVFVLTLIQL
jgi:hypothetical protein